MIVSGYLIQTAVGDVWRQTWIAMHLIASALFLIGYGAHMVKPLRIAFGPAPAPVPRSRSAG